MSLSCGFDQTEVTTAQRGFGEGNLQAAIVVVVIAEGIAGI
ncbi:MAG: hypothetical protein U0Y68_00780 [Blastocatellia bacterium]